MYVQHFPYIVSKRKKNFITEGFVILGFKAFFLHNIWDWQYVAYLLNRSKQSRLNNVAHIASYSMPTYWSNLSPTRGFIYCVYFLRPINRKLDTQHCKLLNNMEYNTI